jgi:hypothetical protein
VAKGLLPVEVNVGREASEDVFKQWLKINAVVY